MYSSSQPTQASSTSTSAPLHPTTAETHRATTAPSQPPQSQQYPPSQSQQQQQQASYGTSASASRQPKPKPQQTRATAAEPYPTQESTWWEEGVSPHPSRAEQGYGPEPSAQQPQGYSALDERSNMYGSGQDQSGQYGRREDKRDEKQGVINWNKVAKIVCAVLLPPLGVFLETGCDKSLAINVLLTILGYIPGIIHAIYVIVTD